MKLNNILHYNSLCSNSVGVATRHLSDRSVGRPVSRYRKLLPPAFDTRFNSNKATLPSSPPAQQIHFAVSPPYPCGMVYVMLIEEIPGEDLPQIAGHMDGLDSKSVPFRIGISRKPPSAQPTNKIPSEYTKQFTCRRRKKIEELVNRHYLSVLLTHQGTLTATPNDTALCFRRIPPSNVKDATLPVLKPVNKLIFPHSVLHFRTEHGPEPRFAGSL